jgi:tetratricopeptide (TPR) repeat protein
MPCRSLKEGGWAVKQIFWVLLYVFLFAFTTCSLAADGEKTFDGLYQKARDFSITGEWELAEKAYLDLTKHFSGTAESWFLLGKFLMGQERFDESIEYFEKGLEINPVSETAYLNLAWIYLVLEDPEKSLEHTAKMREIQAQSKNIRADAQSVEGSNED